MRFRLRRSVGARPADVEVEEIVCPLVPFTPFNYGGGTLSWSGVIGQCYDAETDEAVNVDILQLQQCIWDLVTGGWQQLSCEPSADSAYQELGVSELIGPSTYYHNCVHNRYYATWVWGYAQQGTSWSSDEEDTTDNGTKC